MSELIIYKIVLTIIALSFACVLIKKRIQAKREKRKNTRKRVNTHYQQQELIQYFIHQIELAEELDDVYILHIKLWAKGIQHPNFGPNKYGMFRTNDILLMNKEEVFLGNIWGLNTLTLPQWYYHPEERNLVLEQYKNVLISNLKSMLD